MKGLLQYLKEYKKECILAPLFKMLEASFELFVPLVVAAIIDRGIASADKGYIVQRCLILLLLALIGLTCSVTAQFFSAKAAVGFATKLRHALFEHLQGLSFSRIDQIGTSTMITRMTSDINQTQTGVNMVLRLFLRSPFVVFGAMIMAFTIDVRCAFYFVIAIILLTLVVAGITIISIPMMKAVQGKLDDVMLSARENLTGVRVLRAFCKEEEEVRRFAEKNRALTAQQKKTGNLSGLTNPLTYVIINFCIIFLIWTGAVRVNLGILTQGQVVALYNYMSQILVELIKLANLIVTINKALASANRISDVFEIQTTMQYGTYDTKKTWDEAMRNRQNEEVSQTACETDEIIRFSHVDLAYHEGGENALSDIDFSVKRGQIVGVIGGTGCGKTSLVHLITRFYDATNGHVYLDGRDIKDYTKQTLEEKIAIVMQKAVLFQGTIADNLRWGKPDASEQEMWEAIETAQATDVVNKKGGLQGEVAQAGKNFSGGQRQRLTIARSLIKKSDIVILDDSASALDMATDAALRKAIRSMDYKPTVFIVSQRTNAIMDADMILVLDDGKIVGQGTHDSLLETCDVYREIYESQYKTKEEQ